MTVAALFAGIGGIELGLERSGGFETDLVCEIDPAAQAVLRKRFPNAKLVSDVRGIETLGQTVITCGFPCQDLSQAGRTRGIEGERSGLVAELLRILGDSDPEWVLIENVPFMLQLQRGAAMRRLTDDLERLGFDWAYRVVDTRSFGIPQRRRRVIVLASRIHDPSAALFKDDAGEPEDSLAADAAKGFYWTEGNRGLGWAEDAIPTLKGGSGLGIPSAPAIWLSDGTIGMPDIRDAERLQGFPAGWTEPAELEHTYRVRWRLVGNAVSVPVAEWVGDVIQSPGPCVEPPRALNSRSSWPRAAMSLEGQRSTIEVSEWPRQSDYVSLADFLDHPLSPLSERATRGFHSRLTSSSLRIPAGFQDALEAHLSAVS